MRTSTAWINARHALLAMSMLLVCACASDPPRTQTAQAVDIAKVDAGPIGPPPTEDPVAVREELLRLIDGAIVVVDDYFTRCQARERGGATNPALQRLRAGLYADRDELAIRTQRDDWGGRDVSAWLRQRRQDMSDAKAALAECMR
ncbi:MAG: hypothetical protein JST00_12345 [Deltaproteobacteria bacterium]|nr:hypothetical protein [Deltaproteobacteria bacterium]